MQLEEAWMSNRFSSENVRHAEIIVGIIGEPQTESHSVVVSEIAKGLRNYFPDFISTIVNIDSGAGNESRASFLDSADSVPKIWISMPSGARGRGNQMNLLLKEVERLKAHALVIVDSGSTSITPEWIRELATPILYGYDFVTPVYSRIEPEDSIGSNVCYPIIYGLLGKDVRYPTSGNMAISSELAQHCLLQQWSEPVMNSGVDIFMTMNALLGRFECCQVALGPKFQKTVKEDSNARFDQVVAVFFEQLLTNKDHWLSPVDVSNFRVFGEHVPDPKSSPQRNELASEAFSKFNRCREALASAINPKLFADLCRMYDQRSVTIDSRTWVQVLYEVLYQYDKSDVGEGLIKGLESLYMGRLSTLLKESQAEGILEKVIRRQAQCFFKFRNMLTQKYEYKLAVA
jgi:hypothetical protein